MSSNIASIYRGFRLQDVYCLDRLVADTDSSDKVFSPEGLEDLLIMDSKERPLETVQVKGRSQALTLSMLEPRNPRKFFARIATAMRETPEIKIRLVSFGPIGESLQAAIDGVEPHHSTAADTIAESGVVSRMEASQLLRRLTTEVMDGENVTNRLLEHLGRTIAGLDTTNALRILQTWIRHCAETSTPITKDDLISELNGIGKVLGERNAHHHVWYRSVIPIETAEITEEKATALRDRFYDGASATYEHILTGLDVIREVPIQQISAGFETKRVVVIRGASGQGKSTLAFRYLHDHCRGLLCYQIHATEKEHEVQDIAVAVSGHMRALGLPAILYIEVRPLDSAWSSLVHRLSEIDNAFILVTIREEDWKRDPLRGYRVDHETVELEFTEEEARLMYAGFEETGPIATNIGFEDAWIKFGRGRALLEFVYFIMQGRSLRDRLEEQVHRLEQEVRVGKMTPEELDLLRLASIANAYEARVDITALASSLKLPALKATLALFEGEHLIRVDEGGAYIIGLHSIRSTILTELLTDPVSHPWPNSAARCLAMIEESDMADFLLYAFSRREDQVAALLSAVRALPVQTWKGALGIVRSLLWFGLAQYVRDNGALLDEVHSVAKSTFWLILNFDIADAMPGTDMGQGFVAEHIDPSWRETFDAFRIRQSDKTQALAPLRDWYTAFTATLAAPSSVEDWEAYAEVTFWCGRAHVGSPLVEAVPEDILIGALDELPLATVAVVTAGLSEGRPRLAAVILREKRSALQQRFQRDTDSIKLEDDGEIIDSVFIVPFNGERETLKRAGANSFGDMQVQAMWRIKLLRLLFPDRKKYCVQGYGHKFFASLDETVKRIDVSMLPFDWLTALNSQFIELASRRYRMDSWLDFADAVMRLRQSIVERIVELKRKLRSYCSNVRIEQLWADASSGKHVNGRLWLVCSEALQHPPPLPKAAGDEWGFVRLDSLGSDARIKQAADSAKQNEALSPSSASLWAYQSAALYLEFSKIYREYIKEWNIFFLRGREVLALSPLVGRRARSDAERDKYIRKAEELKIATDAHYPTLNALNSAVRQHRRFQEQFLHLLEKHVDAEQLATLEQAETSAFEGLWQLWYLFAFFPNRVYLDPYKEAARLMDDVLERTYKDLSMSLLRSPDLPAATLVYRDGPHWNGQPALWVLIDADEAGKEHEYVGVVLDILVQILPRDEERFLRFYVYHELCDHLVVVPLLNGRSENSQAWVFSMSGHAIDPDRSDIPAHELQSRKLPADAMEHFIITQWSSPALTACNELAMITDSLWLYAKHLAEIVSAEGIDDVGAEIASDYSISISPDIQELFDRIGPCWENLAESYSIDDAEVLIRDHPLVVKAMLSVEMLRSTLFPEMSEGEESRKMSVNQVVDWGERLQRARETVRTMKALCIQDAIDQEDLQ